MPKVGDETQLGDHVVRVVAIETRIRLSVTSPGVGKAKRRAETSIIIPETATTHNVDLTKGIIEWVHKKEN